MQKDKRIKLLKNTKNRGVFHSRYIGSLNAQGEYIYFIDPDDLLYDILLEAYKEAITDDLDIVQFLYIQYFNGKYSFNDYLNFIKHNLGYIGILKDDEVKYNFCVKTGKDKQFYFSYPMLWDKIIKRKIVLKAYLDIGDTYLNKHLITMDDGLLAIFIFRNAKSFKYILKVGYSWNMETTGSIESENRKMKNPKIVNKRFHDIFTYFKILYEKTENSKTERLCIFQVYKSLCKIFYKKLIFLSDGFDLINKVFSLYKNIVYLDKIEKQDIKNYYERFLNSKHMTKFYE